MQLAVVKKKSIPALLSQAVQVQFSGEDKQWGQDELLDTIFWMRQLIALICGIVWGIIPLKGMQAFLGFLAVFYGTVIVWVNQQRIDADDYGGGTVVFGEGAPPAIGLFMLLWIATYTAINS